VEKLDYFIPPAEAKKYVQKLSALYFAGRGAFFHFSAQRSASSLVWNGEV